MKKLLDKMNISIKHLSCLDKTFRKNSPIYKEISDKINGGNFSSIYEDIARELYAGGKQTRGHQKLHRQMILGDIIEYIYTGRAYYYACDSEDNLKNFTKLIFYVVNQLLLMDSITVNPNIRKEYLNSLKKSISLDVLCEKENDKILMQELIELDNIKYTDTEWKKYDEFIDSLLPKTLGTPKELIVFIELIHSKKGLVLPLLLTQRLLGGDKNIAPPDFLLLRKSKDIYGIEVGYEKESQCRDFMLRTAIPTIAVDLHENMHNRCPICGEIILYCDKFIEAYSEGNDYTILKCQDCSNFNDGDCPYSVYYGKYKGADYNGEELISSKKYHYHTRCIKEKNGRYEKYKKDVNILEIHKSEFYAQYPKIEGLEELDL